MAGASDPSRRAERLFAEWLYLEARGETEDWERFVRAHAEVRERLERLRERWDRCRTLFEELGAERASLGSLREILEEEELEAFLRALEALRQRDR